MITRLWNFEHLSGVIFLEIPIEEILWAFTFGALWSSIYEYFNGYTIK